MGVTGGPVVIEWTYNTVVVLLGVSLLGAASGLIGAFAVLRRQALLGDAVAHAALPGVCLGVWLAGGRSFGLMLAGAAAAGLAAVGLLALMRRYTRVRDDAAMGAVQSVLFGLGIAAASMLQHGSGAGVAGIETFLFGKTAGIVAADVYAVAGVCLLLAVAVAAFLPDLTLVSFDRDFAGAIGRPVLLFDALIMVLLVATVVVGLPAVGVVLVASLLIAPAAAARFWTATLVPMLVLSAILGAGVGAAGALASAAYAGLPTGPVVTLIGAGVLGLSAALGTRRRRGA